MLKLKYYYLLMGEKTLVLLWIWYTAAATAPAARLPAHMDMGEEEERRGRD